ncbi:hypothetical protein [Halomarina oriensis]|uniref:Yip1 domain-containing protein n=1 Tax=Halomarina oriensis TaxID=671145 RepID=A0A6B0GGS2_9EURY|nr:hypothetical protein [Halomarina oriensis]MWG34062.1 hypothetical protein [Halomarina oriensis]
MELTLLQAEGAVGSIIGFVVSLLIGGLGIYVGARVIAGVDDYSKAVITALIGAIAWAVGSLIPLVGFLVALVAYLAVVNWQYPGGWLRAAGISFVAWLASLLVLFVLALLNVVAFEALGVPGV